MSKYIVHDSLGSILRIVTCPDESAVDNLHPGETIFKGEADPYSQFIYGGVITNKPSLDAGLDKSTVAGNGVEIATISGLPNPTDVVVSGPGVLQRAAVTTGTLSLTFNLSGAYLVSLMAVNKLPKEFTINAT